MQHHSNGQFAGICKEDKAALVLGALSVDRQSSLRALMAATGLSAAAVHQGLRYLREVRPQCVVTYKKGPASYYKLAEDAPEVGDYARRRMSEWQTQIRVMNAEMQAAIQFLSNGAENRVQRASKVLASLLDLLDLNEKEHAELGKREKAVEKRERRLATAR